MAVTIKDIAKLAKVDVGSVSRTLRNHPEALRLREETRKRIWRIADELGYHRNQLAAAVRTGIAKTIGIILSDNEYSAMQVTGIMREAMKCGFDVKLYPDSEPEKTFSKIMENQIKNVIVLSACDTLREKAAVLARKYGIRLVYISEYSHGEFPAINIDNFAAAEMATDYLIRCGHRRIALSCAQHDLHSEQDFGRKYILERHNGFIHALKQAGITPDPELLACTEDYREYMRHLFSLPKSKRPTAVFAIGDACGVVVENVAVEMGLKVPDDISVIGFGNSETICEMAHSELSSVGPALSITEYGEMAVKLLFRLPGGMKPDANNNCLIRPKLFIRKSVKNRNLSMEVLP